MRHNAHYTTKFDGYQIPTTVAIIDKRNDYVIKEYVAGHDFGDFLSDVYKHLKEHAVELDVGGARMTIFGLATRLERIRLSVTIRDFIRKVA